MFKTTSAKIAARYEEIIKSFSDTEPNLLHFYWMLSRTFSLGLNVIAYKAGTEAAALNHRLLGFGLIERIDTINKGTRYVLHRLSESGRQFLNRLRIEKELSEAEKLVL